MDNITKALQDLAKAIENQNAVASVKITITLKNQKASKATIVATKFLILLRFNVIIAYLF